MPQEFMILKCYGCSMYQVHQVRKSKTWKCKLCNEKQSQQKLFGQGSGKECRIQVQKLNMSKGELQHRVEDSRMMQDDKSEIQAMNQDNTQKVEEDRKSKWEVFSTAKNNNDELLSDDDGDREISVNDYENIQKCVTIDRNEWMGCKSRKNFKRKSTSNNTSHCSVKANKILIGKENNPIQPTEKIYAEWKNGDITNDLVDKSGESLTVPVKKLMKKLPGKNDAKNGQTVKAHSKWNHFTFTKECSESSEDEDAGFVSSNV